MAAGTLNEVGLRNLAVSLSGAPGSPLCTLWCSSCRGPACCSCWLARVLRAPALQWPVAVPRGLSLHGLPPPPPPHRSAPAPFCSTHPHPPTPPPRRCTPQALQALAAGQRVPYDFEFFSLDQPADAPVTALSLGRSLLKEGLGVALPLRPTAPLGEPLPELRRPCC
jgi:hypothetical protein